MTKRQLTAVLAERALGWRVGADRFLLGGGQWLPHWRFQPFENAGDAQRLLEKVATSCSLRFSKAGYSAEVRVGPRKGNASGKHMAQTITTAVAIAIGIDCGEVAP